MENLNLEEQLKLKSQRIIELEKEKEELAMKLKAYEDNDFIKHLILTSKKMEELQNRQDELEQHILAYKVKIDELKKFGLIK